MFTVIVPYAIEDQRVEDLLCTSLEGGSNYWYFIEKFISPSKEALEAYLQGRSMFRHLAYPMCGGALLFIDEEDPRSAGVYLNRLAIECGLLTMAEKFPRHWKDFISENEDADTGDVFLQCCLFGEVIYG